METIKISTSELQAHFKEQEAHFCKEQEAHFCSSPQYQAETKVDGLNDNQSSLNNLSSVEIICYRLVLEETYRNPVHDDWHGDGIPQKFRESLHTFEEMETAIVRFMERIQKEEDTGVEGLAFIKVQEALPEYQDYAQKQKAVVQSPSNQKLKAEASLAWKSYVKACAALPEYKALLAAKERRYLFATLRITEEESAIIQTYFAPLRSLVKKLAIISHAQDHVYSLQQMENFRHNMKWLFVPVMPDNEWSTAHLKTLWKDGWRENEIIRFMMNQKAQYIMSHNEHIIQYQDIDGTLARPIIRVFEKSSLKN